LASAKAVAFKPRPCHSRPGDAGDIAAGLAKSLLGVDPFEKVWISSAGEGGARRRFPVRNNFPYPSS
jgi:hypothetical protein